MAPETQTDIWEETGSWADAVRPLREQAQAHPWLGVAAAFAAGAMLGALSGGEERVVRVRVGRGEQVRIGLRLPEPVEEEVDEAPEEVEAGPTRRERLRRVGSAVRERVEEWRDDLPRPLRRPTRMERIRDAVADALPRRRPRTLGERVRRAFE
jgi:hypothetical protein